MPQVKESIIRTLIKRALKEAELSAGPDNTKFKIKILVSNPQSETKQGIRIHLTPSGGFLEPDAKSELSAAIMTKFNDSLKQFNLQISLDTDTQDPEVMGFFIPLEQLQNMIEVALGAKKEDEGGAPVPPPQGVQRPASPKPPTDIPDIEDEEELAENEDPLDRAARLAKEPLPGMSKMTGLGMKRSQYDQEEGGKLPLKELYETSTTVQDGMLTLWHDIVNDSDYKFKEYLTNNEDQWVRTGAIVSMITDELGDRLELEEPVGPDMGVEPLNEMRQRTLNEISKVVMKEDFYDFINKGNNILRSCEDAGIQDGKKYLIYLVKHNIM